MAAKNKLARMAPRFHVPQCNPPAPGVTDFWQSKRTVFRSGLRPGDFRARIPVKIEPQVTAVILLYKSVYRV
jgi:hypothetical protein